MFWFRNKNSNFQLHTDTHIRGQPRYLKLAYLEYTAYVEVLIHF